MRPSPPAKISSLAVATGERWPRNAGEPADFAMKQRKIAEDVRGFELVLIARVLKARDHARALAEVDIRFRPVANLFVSATAVLLDAVEECGDARDEDFETGDGLIAYVRSRGLIAPDAPTVRMASDLTIDDSFLVAKRIALGPLLDMAATFLDALDVQYELFVEGEPGKAPTLSIDPDDINNLPLH